jgi:hypothetical protein
MPGVCFKTAMNPAGWNMEAKKRRYGIKIAVMKHHNVTIQSGNFILLGFKQLKEGKR